MIWHPKGVEVRHLTNSVVAFSFTLWGFAAGAEAIQKPARSEASPSYNASIVLAGREVGEIAKVKVDRAGRIYFNGRIVSLENLKREFSRLPTVAVSVC